MAADVKYLMFTELTVCHQSRGETPDSRSGHRIIMDSGGGNLYSIGGYNPDFSDRVNDTDTPLFKEMWRFNLASRRWTKLKCRGQMPDALASHTALLDGNFLVLFGGTGVPFGEAASNELCVCRLSTLEWSRVVCTGQLPICLYGHTLTQSGRCLYLFGGTTGWQYNSDLHRLNLDTSEWSAVEVSGLAPAGRYRHEVAAFDNKLFVLGGGRSNVVYDFETLPVIDLSSNIWSVVTCQPDRCCRMFPSPRRCHSSVQLQSDVYICGGYNGQEIFSDLWKLCLLTMQWTLLPGRLPQPVYFHSAATTADGLMLVHGGVTEIDARRTAKVFAVWLRVPPLRELAWQALIAVLGTGRLRPASPSHVGHALGQTDAMGDSSESVDRCELTRASLLELGVPADLVDRLE